LRLPWFGNAIGVREKIGTIAILPTVANNSFGNWKWQQLLEIASHEPLAMEVGDNTQKDGVGASSNAAINLNEVWASSSARPSKRANKDDNAHDGLVQAIDRGNETLYALADVLREVAVAKTVKANLLDGLFEDVDNLSGFEIHHKSKYYAYLVDNPQIARAFMDLSLLYKVSWVTSFVDENF
jgi:hypothetical protein